MELLKKNIHMNRVKNRILTQITLDDDFIVPDIKADIDAVITSEGEVVIDSVRVNEGRVNVRGKLAFRILYMCNSGEKRLHNMSGELQFDENLLMNDIKEGDNVNVKWDIEDLSIGIINTRKISGRAVVSLEAVAEETYNIEMVAGVEKDENTYVDFLKKEIEVSQIAISKKDIIRIKEDIDIPSNRGNIYNILWNTVRLKNTLVKLMDGKALISGEISAVVLYEVEEENAPVQWIDTSIPFSNNIDINCTEEMIPDIEIGISSVNINAKPDNDGEQRVIELDMVIELGIKIYSEENVSFISDIYSTSCELIPATEKVTYNRILMKNLSKAKVNDKLKLDSANGNVMQVFGSDGVVKIDDVKIGEETQGVITVSGIVDVNIMYISSNDMKPICVTKQVIPFIQNIEAPDITEDSIVFIRPSLEQLITGMVGSNEIEAKAVVALDTLVLKLETEEIVKDVTEEPFDMEKIKNIPCMSGYMVKRGDSLWKIAKKYYTTVDNIKSVNELKGDGIKEGDMLLVVKESM